MKNIKKILVILIFINPSCLPLLPSYQDNLTVFQDQDFATNIGFCTIGERATYGTINNPVSSLGGLPLTLTFDLLQEEYQNLYLKIFHCDKDWKKSLLNEIEYLSEYNEFPINTYSFSQANLSSYISYQQRLPTVKISGNFCVAVYNADNQSLLFTRRFLVIEESVSIQASKVWPIQNEIRNSHHRLEVEIHHPGLEIISPSQDISTILLQNHNWQSSKLLNEPNEIRSSEEILVYRPFDQSTTFYSGNDFRYFDVSTLAAKGINIASTYTQNGKAYAKVENLFPRAQQSFSEPFLKDLNGGFILCNQNPFQESDQSEYVNVQFVLKTEKINTDLFITSRYFQWRLLPENKLIYDSIANEYYGQIRVKQGFHNFKINAISDNENEVEGNFQQTQNEYEILVYYRKPGTVYDRIVGYKSID